MANIFYGYARTTCRYAIGWDHLNDWRYVGRFSVLNHGLPTYTDKYGDSWEYVVTIKAPKGVSQSDVEAVANSHFNTACRCEHDCCGHVRTHGRYLRHAKRREHLVLISCYRNV